MPSIQRSSYVKQAISVKQLTEQLLMGCARGLNLFAPEQLAAMMLMHLRLATVLCGWVTRNCGGDKILQLGRYTMFVWLPVS